MGVENRGIFSALNPFSGLLSGVIKSGTARASTPQPDRRVFLVVIDDSEEIDAALRFACRRAANTGGRVALFSAIEGPEFQHWMFVGNLMQEEAREQAEERLQRFAATVHALSGEMPEIVVGEGDLREALFDLVNEDDGISVVVLGASTDERGPGPLVEAMTGRYAGKLRVPVTIVPGNLGPDEIDGLT